MPQQLADLPMHPTAPPTVRPVPPFQYVGCSYSPRRHPALPLSLSLRDLTLEKCAVHCSDMSKPIFGVTRSRFCGCGDVSPIAPGQDRPISECDKGCAGNMT